MILSVDDGCSSDIRLAELANKYGIKTIFYWPVNISSLAFNNGYEPLTLEQCKKISKEHEIGSHTITHRHLTKIPYEEACKEIKDSQLILESKFDVMITKFCPPRGYTNQSLTEFTLEHYESQRLTRGKGLVHIHPNSGANNNIPWRKAINESTEEIWCHSWELNKFDLWDELEEVLSENSSC